jgi:hypothetical protein
VTTKPASAPPSAPTAVAAQWTAPGSPGDMLVVTWSAPSPGDSPIDKYRVRIVGSDLAGTFVQAVGPSTLTAASAVSDVPAWTITVKAHNAAGWAPGRRR